MNGKLRQAEMMRACCIAVALVSALLTGCGAPGPLMPEQRSSTASESRPPPAPEAYRVRSGDTLYSIAFGYGLDWRRVARWNDIGAPYTIHVGDWIRLQPPPDMRPAVVADTSRTPETARTPPRLAAGRSSEPAPATSPGVAASTQTQQPGSSRAAGDSAPADPEPRPAATPAPRRSDSDARPGGNSGGGSESAPVPAAATRSVAGVAWRWPTEGGVARGFNSGASRKGILISGEGGQPIRAAADGEVVYSGNGLIGYGELIIIKHSDRMLSAYAHNRERLVGEGQNVRSGQLIARMGSDERERFVLHFEIRRDGKPDDPAGYLPPR